MKVLIDARYLDGSYSGIGTYSRQLLEALARVDTETRYQVVVRPGFRESLVLGPNFELYSCRYKPVSVYSYFRIHDMIDDVAPDLVHCLSPTAPVRYGGNLLVTVHDLQPFIDENFHGRRPGPVCAAYELFYRWAYPAVFRRAKWIICDSYATRDDMAEFFPVTIPKLIVVHPGLDRQRFEPAGEGQVGAVKAKYDLHSPYLLYYGSTRPNKNLSNLVRAFGKILADHPNELGNHQLVLVLKRDRFLRDVQRTISSLGLEQKVRLIDPLEQAEQRAMLAGSQLFCFPTKHEGFGFPLLEAMASGVPALGSTSGSLPEVAGEASVLADPDSTDSIASAMARMLLDRNLRTTLIEKGRARAKTFEWQNAAERIRDIYHLLY